MMWAQGTKWSQTSASLFGCHAFLPTATFPASNLTIVNDLRMVKYEEGGRLHKIAIVFCFVEFLKSPAKAVKIEKAGADLTKRTQLQS